MTDQSANQQSKYHEHYNGICKKEFTRGYAFGRRESYDEILRLPNVAAKEGFTDGTVVIKIPREEYIRLQAEVEKNL